MKDVLGNHLMDLLFHLVHLLSITPKLKDQSQIHQFGKKISPGLFLGYALYAGGGGGLRPILANPILANPFLAIVFGQPILANPFLAKIRG